MATTKLASSDKLIDSDEEGDNSFPGRSQNLVAPTLTKNTQNKNEKDINESQTATMALNNNTEIMKEMFAWLQSRETSTFNRKPPTFSGKSEEKPDVFVHNFEEFVRKEGIPIEEVVDVFFECLEGKAARQMSKYRMIRLVWRELKEHFYEEFNNLDLIV